MKTVGIVGVTAEGAADCYKAIVKLALEKLGHNKHPEIVLVNPSFDLILAAQKKRDWHAVAGTLVAAAQKCVAAGADFIIIPANSVHFAYDLVAKSLDVPVVNIVEVVADQCKARGFKIVAVLGVGLTMSDGLYDGALNRRSIQQVMLGESEKVQLDNIIYGELVNGVIKPASVEKVLSICTRLASKGCDALILACTELQMILDAHNAPIPILDSTELLAANALAKALE